MVTLLSEAASLSSAIIGNVMVCLLPTMSRRIMHALIKDFVKSTFGKNYHGVPDLGYNGHHPGYYGHNYLDLIWQAHIGRYDQN